MDFPQAY